MLDIVFLSLMYMIVSFDNQIFDKVIVVKKLDQLICTLYIKLVVLHIQVEQVGVIS